MVIEGEGMGAGFDRKNPHYVHIWNCQTTKRNTIKNQLSMKRTLMYICQRDFWKDYRSRKSTMFPKDCFWGFWKLEEELKSHGLGTLQICVNWLKVCHEKWFGDSTHEELHIGKLIVGSQPTLTRMLKPDSTSFGTTRPRERGALLLTLRFLSV